MKRIITVLFAALFCLCAQTYAQNRADELMKQAQESLAKKEYIKAKKEDIVIVKSPVGMPGRAIKNKFMEKVINGEKFTPKKCLGCLARCNPKEIPYCITERLIYAAKGKTDEALLFCGADAYKVNKYTTVKKVFKELLEEKNF